MATTLYISTSGNDSNNGLSPSTPFRSAQKGFLTARFGGSGDYVLQFSAGTYSGIRLTSAWPSRIQIKGASASTTFLGGIDAAGNDSTGSAPAENGYPITLISDGSINLQNVSSNGGFDNGYDSGQYPIAGAGGTIDLTGCVFTNVYANGGESVFTINSDGSHSNRGGSITLHNCTGLDVVASGNDNCGGGGSITAYNSNLRDLDASTATGGGFGGDCGDANAGGTISITSCTVRNVSANGGATDSGVGGNAGTFSQTSSTVTGSISLGKGYPQPDCFGFIGGDASTDCFGNCYSPSNEDGHTVTDPNGSLCHDTSQDALGYCCGDAVPDCYGTYYSPSNEDGNTYNGECSYNTVDNFGRCCGGCYADCLDGYGCYNVGNNCGCGCGPVNCDNCGGCGEKSGCTDGYACNYNSCANYDDGSCIYDVGCGCGNPPPGDNCGGNCDCPNGACDNCGTCGGQQGGCTDPSATNYNQCFVTDDGSCIYCAYGCMDVHALNYDSSATCSAPSTCLYSTFNLCWLPGYCNSQGAPFFIGDGLYTLSDAGTLVFDGVDTQGRYTFTPGHYVNEGCYFGCNDAGAQNFHEPSCNACWYTNCNDSGACNYDQNAPGNTECVFPADLFHRCDGTCSELYTTDCGLGCGSEADGCGNCVMYGEGCYSPSGCNACGQCNDTAVNGCTDFSACNYHPLATCDNGSCYYPDDCGGCNRFHPLISGCMDPRACDYDPNAYCGGIPCYYDWGYGCGHSVPITVEAPTANEILSAAGVNATVPNAEQVIVGTRYNLGQFNFNGALQPGSPQTNVILSSILGIPIT